MFNGGALASVFACPKYKCIMIVNVNNKAVETSASTLSQLVEELHLPENGVAVGVDNRMVPSATWHEYQLSEGMNLVIIKAACGG